MGTPRVKAHSQVALANAANKNCKIVCLRQRTVDRKSPRNLPLLIQFPVIDNTFKTPRNQVLRKIEI